MNKKPVKYWMKEFQKLNDLRFHDNLKNFAEYPIYSSFMTEDGLSQKEMDQLTEFLIKEAIRRGIMFPQHGFINYIKFAQDHDIGLGDLEQ